jgi:hypothetical protein
MKGASGTTNIWKLRLQLMKPVTWIPLIWGVICGAAASGNYHWQLDHVLAAFACMLMSGPLLAGFTQTINDYYDRDIDAINEPYRPIPSGAISLGQVKVQIWVLLLAGLGVSYGLDVWAQHTTPVVLLLALGWFLCELHLFSAALEVEAERLARELCPRRELHRSALVGRPSLIWAAHLDDSIAHPGLQLGWAGHCGGERFQKR